MSFIADGNKTVVVADKTFTAGESLISQWYDVSDFDGIRIVAFTDSLSDSNGATIEFADIEDDEIVWDASTTIADPALGGINISFYIPRKAKFFRVRYTHGPIPARLYASLTFQTGNGPAPVYQMLFPLDDEDTALVTRSVITRQDPDGDYVNQRQGGIHPDLTTDTPLVANGVYRSAWTNVAGFVEISATLKTDQSSAADGAVVQFAREIFTPLNITNITQANPAVVTVVGHGIPDSERVLIDGVVGMTEVNDRYFTITVLDADTFELNGEDSTGHTGYISGGTVEQVRVTREVTETVNVPTSGIPIDVYASTAVADLFTRIQYTNGPIAQGLFNLHTQITDVAHTGDIRILGAPELEFSSPAQVTKSVLYAHPNLSTSKPSPVRKNDSTDGLNVHTVGHDVRTPISPVNSKRKSQVNVGPTPLRVLVTPLANRVSLGIRNLDDDTQLFYGHSASITPTSGSMLIDPKDLYVDEIDGSVQTWLVTGPVGAATGTQTLTGSATSSVVNVTDPDNLLTDNALFAEFDALNSTLDVTLNDFTFTPGFDTISNVKIKARMRKSDTSNVTVAHQATVTGTAIAVPAVSTTGLVTSDASSKYLAAVSFTDTAQNVSSISGLGLTWTQVAAEENDTRVEVWEGTGTPTGDGIVTASLSASAGDAAIAVSRYASVNSTTPIEVSAVAKAGNNMPSGSVNADTAGDMVYAALTQNRYPSTPDGGISERADFGTGGGSQDIQLCIMDRSVSTPGSNTISSTLSGGAEGWSMVLVSLNKGAGTNPTMDITYEVSGVPGSTSLTQVLDTTTATEYEADITADRVWSDADLDATTLHPTQTGWVDTDGRIEYLRLDVEETEPGGAIRVALDESAESL